MRKIGAAQILFGLSGIKAGVVFKVVTGHKTFTVTLGQCL